jgi:MerR family transcriptional regulator, copper efflux regulator
VRGLLIGEVARRAGVSTPTTRYYEELGLLAPPARSSSGYRRYSERVLEDVRFIRKAQVLGFSLDEIAEILTLSRSGKSACVRVLSLAQQHLAALDERIEQLHAFREQLAGELAKWDGKAAPACIGLCQIIDVTELEAVNVDAKMSFDILKRRRVKATL